MTDERLRQLFRYYNRRYWNGELPRYTLVMGVELGDDFKAICYKPPRQLWFNDRNIKSDRDWRITLLHEMAHIRAKLGHGESWISELRRCPDYVLRHEAGCKEVFVYLKHGIGGPFRRH